MPVPYFPPRDSGLSAIQNKAYVFTKAGDIREVTDSVKVATYTYKYDSLHRLEAETSSNDSYDYLQPVILEFDYDENTSKHSPSGVQRKDDYFTFLHDANGNLTDGYDLSKPSAASRDIAYNPDNMPTSIDHATGGNTAFVYDGEAKRAKKVISGGPTGTAGATYYVGDHFEVIKGIQTRYIFAGNLRVAKISSAGTFYFHKDHLGSTTVMTNENGQKVESSSFLPYGGNREVSSVSVSDYRFTDQEKDTSTGLYNYDARLYDPAVGQFISPDSIVPDWYDPQALNRYSYCLNNPLIYTDPTGHMSAFHQFEEAAKKSKEYNDQMKDFYDKFDEENFEEAQEKYNEAQYDTLPEMLDETKEAIKEGIELEVSVPEMVTKEPIDVLKDQLQDFAEDKMNDGLEEHSKKSAIENKGKNSNKGSTEDSSEQSDSGGPPD